MFDYETYIRCRAIVAISDARTYLWTIFDRSDIDTDFEEIKVLVKKLEEIEEKIKKTITV